MHFLKLCKKENVTAARGRERGGPAPSPFVAKT